MFTIEDLESQIVDLNEKVLRPIRMDRGRRYGKLDDTLYNVKKADPERAWRGAFTSAQECMSRLENYYFVKSADMTPEQIKDFENACEDMVNYSLYVWILFNQKLNETKPCLTCG